MEALKQYEIENRTAVCRTARTVVWEGGEIPLYPIFGKLLAKNRQRGALGIELSDQHICKSVEKNIVEDEFLNEKNHNLLNPFLLDGFLLARSALACASTFIIAVNVHRMTCSAFARNQTLAVAAEQLCGQQILVLGFMLGWSFLVCGGSLLYLFK